MRFRALHEVYECVNSGLYVDFSTNLNPLGPPRMLSELVGECVRSKVWTQYPDPNYSELREAIASFYDLDPERIILCSCASEAVNLVIMSVKPHTVFAVAPARDVPEHACTALGIKLRYVLMCEEKSKFEVCMESLARYVRGGGTYVVLVVNPNDPTGTYMQPGEVLSLASEFKNTLFIVNEAYVDLSGMDSLTKYDVPENVVVIRSLTESLASPGLSLSFIYGGYRSLTEVLDSLRPKWNISSLCSCTYTKLLRDHAAELREYLADSVRCIREWREYLVGHLRLLGLKVFDSVTNYVLVKHSGIDARYLHKILVRRYGVAVHPAHVFYGLGMDYSRFSVRHPRYCNVLLRALEDVLKAH
ncbi:MAG: histidinol-phosphate aminotransferase family protein [Desulfurococcales archaeon]|nr:histidinol-phosphate aminotransferase family protein [Desulfurococcales archaeon]